MKGTFEDATLPTGWSFGIDGTTQWIEKVTVPVESASGSGVKATFDPSTGSRAGER